MANADTPRDAERARRYGARRHRPVPHRADVQRPAAAADRAGDDPRRHAARQRQAALDRLLPIQREDFKGIFAAMAGLPVTVRLLDPPMHEFLPTVSQLEFEIAHLRNLQRAARSVAELPETLRLLDPELPREYVDGLARLLESLKQYRDSARGDAALARREAMLRKVHALTEVNPMLGHRGVRLGISFPEIYEMQIRAMLEATAECLQGRRRRAAGDHGAAGGHRRGAEAGARADGHAQARGRGAPRRQAAREVRHDDRGRPRLHARRRGSPRSPSSSRSAPTT